MDKDFKFIFEQLQIKDHEFEEYVHNKCIKAVSECKEYIEKEYSNQYNDEELSIMREHLIFKTAWFSAMQFFFSYNRP